MHYLTFIYYLFIIFPFICYEPEETSNVVCSCCVLRRTSWCENYETIYTFVVISELHPLHLASYYKFQSASLRIYMTFTCSMSLVPNLLNRMQTWLLRDCFVHAQAQIQDGALHILTTFQVAKFRTLLEWCGFSTKYRWVGREWISRNQKKLRSTRDITSERGNYFVFISLVI